MASRGDFAAAILCSNGVAANLTEFQQAFDLKPGDRLYRAPEDRVKIW